ncbi:replication initiation protein [Candidatus Igneacidithiobacillus taiwanensis]|uniref:replication initiation protein n=1 Tax=Candidatus Igneacidithiobacillus taiwanensis TaxID=1945924 RepID=UPI0028A01274|nr:replication initiation protein [Candidatus Igneacidithiobacillus taiwanensis]
MAVHKHKTPSAEQLAFDLGISASLYHWVQRLPHRPYCTNDLGAGLRIRPIELALAYRYIQHNPPGQVWSIVLDVDRRICDPESLTYCWEAKDPEGPIPNVMAINQENGYGHLFYFLKAGVTRTQAGREAPLRYLAAVERALCAKMDADHLYVGLVSKNLTHAGWLVHSYHDRLWTLGELAEYLDLDTANAWRYVPNTPEEAFQEGRNVYLFHTARNWAYSAIRDYWAPNGLPQWQEAILGHLQAINGQFQVPLFEPELRTIAKSIAKWTWRHITPVGLQNLIERTHTPELQRERGRRGGLAATNQLEIAPLGGKASGQARRQSREQDRATARLLRAKGWTYRKIAAELGVSAATAYRLCR